jgi:hypothetical protein
VLLGDSQRTIISEPSSTGKLVDLLDLKVEGNITHPQAPVTADQTGWYRLLGEYTGRHLTYDSSKFATLSSLAREVAQLTTDKDLAGR